jgi:Limiting CO2-inducible proteins B/C beta carbonyic anhydrases
VYLFVSSHYTGCYLLALLLQAAIAKVQSAFPKAVTNADLISIITKRLKRFGYGRSSLLCTSLCCDEVNRSLEGDLQKTFGDHFNIGGLAGFAWGGVTGMSALQILVVFPCCLFVSIVLADPILCCCLFQVWVP